MGRQHLEEVHQQQPINSYLNNLYSISDDALEKQEENMNK